MARTVLLRGGTLECRLNPVRANQLWDFAHYSLILYEKRGGSWVVVRVLSSSLILHSLNN
jgi:hypothetical protein